MTTPSTHIPGEFIAMDDNPRAIRLQQAIGAKNYRGLPHLTPSRAYKYSALLRCGFSASHVNGQWLFHRHGGRMILLKEAMICIEVMGDLVPEMPVREDFE